MARATIAAETWREGQTPYTNGERGRIERETARDREGEREREKKGEGRDDETQTKTQNLLHQKKQPR